MKQAVINIKRGNKVIIKLAKSQKIPYRVYTKAEINEFLKEDSLSKELAKKLGA